jgi:hypothetical protein
LTQLKESRYNYTSSGRTVSYQQLSKLTHERKHMNKDQEFLEYVVKSLVDNPDQVKAVRTVDEMGVLMTLSVAAPDMGKVIGRDGNTAKAIRTLLRTVGMKNNSRVNLKINEPEGGLRDQSTAAAPRAEKASKTVDEAMADLKI